MTRPDQRVALLDRVATLYYERNRSQDEIARRLGVSRSSVSRLLDEARRAGLVEIRVKHALPRATEVENALLARFPLQEAYVLVCRDQSYETTLARLGALAAQYLETVLHDGDVLAVSWGAALAELVRAFSPSTFMSVQVVQIMGGIGAANPEIDGSELARRLAEKLGGRYRYLNAPLLVDSRQVRDALLQDKSIAESMAIARRANVAIGGIGTMDPRLSSSLRAGYITRSQFDELQRAGAVGEVFSRHFDAQGRVLPVELNDRIIALDLISLRKIPCIICVAGGAGKAQAILGALRGRHINVLITDEQAARQVLALDQDAPAPKRRTSPENGS